MNCSIHNERAGVAVCVNCGAVICSDCVIRTSNNKNVCSELCSAASMSTDNTIRAIASASKRSSKATSRVYWSLGIIFAILGAIARSVDLFLTMYLLAACVVFIGAGFWYNNISKKTI